MECKSCGCSEFISQLNRYDIFKTEKGKIVYQNTENTDEELILYCRDCSEVFVYKNEDIIY